MKLAIIPARGGSKRIPRKNIADFLGKPIIAYSIEIALHCGLFDKVIVSTEDAEIADVAQQYGAEVPFMRPTELADDRTGTIAVIKHALQWFAQHQQHVDYTCCIYATAPLLQAEYLQRGIDQLMASNKSYAFSVTRFDYPIQRALHFDGQGNVEAMHPEYVNTRSQDLPETFHDAGQFYWGKAEAFLNDITMFSRHSVPVFLPIHRVQDIDTRDDWIRAEYLYQALQAERISR